MERIKLTNHFSKSDVPSDETTLEHASNCNWVNFLYAVSLTIISIYLLFIQFEEFKTISVKHALDNSQAVLVDTRNNKIIAGKFSINPHEHCEPLEIGPHNALIPNINGHNKGEIAIVITNLGINKSNTVLAFKLPKNITLGFSPYADDLESLLTKAEHAGFESLINIPMQPFDYLNHDPGPYALLNNLSWEDNLLRLNWVLTRSNKIAGIYSDQNEVFTNISNNLTTLLNEIKRRHLVFIYGSKIGQQNLTNNGLTTDPMVAITTLTLDHKANPQEIEQTFWELEKAAVKNGIAILYINANQPNFDLMYKWLNQLDYAKFNIKPITKIMELSK